MDSRQRQAVWLIVLLIFCGLFGAQLGADEIDFRRDIRPILSDKCFTCHGPDEQVRESELRFDIRDGAFAELDEGRFAIVPGKPNESALIERILSTDQDEVMPPHDHPRQLTESEKRLLSDWIQQGANWQEHWAYEPVKNHPTPISESSQTSPHFIDAFVLKGLQSKHWSHSPSADKRTLFRRLHFDLIGMPPSQQKLNAFLSDSAPNAYEKVVDDLLASKHYGERMATFWLDLVRYADTVGYHGDQDISVSPYRDYVIQSFNANMPFDQFTREQIAGDLFDKPKQRHLLASGYNRLGMMSAEGGVQPKEYLAKYAADRVRNLGSVWLGSTIGCSECHDHKYDPFTMRDFYSFAAFFSDIKERGLYSGANTTGDWGPKIVVPDSEYQGLIKPVDQRITKLTRILNTPTDRLASAQTAWEQNIALQQQKWKPLQHQTVSAMGGTRLKIAEDNSILATGPNPATNVYSIRGTSPIKNITGFRIEVFPDKSLPRKGPGRAGNGNFVITELRILQERAKGTPPEPIPLQNATATIEQQDTDKKNPYGKWSAAGAIDGDIHGATWGWAILPEVGKPNVFVVESKSPETSESNPNLVFELVQNHANHSLGKFRLSVTNAQHSLVADRTQLLPTDIETILAITPHDRNKTQTNRLATFYRSIAPQLDETRKSLAQTNKQRTQIIKDHTRTSLVTKSVKPREIRVLARGDWMDDSGDLVTGAVPSFLGLDMDTPEQRTPNRLDLANWIVDKRNPLTARVFVNRIWKLYFGHGLSRILDDLGSQGKRPTYPELLDRMAFEFMESDWNIKQLVKQIVTSQTYRQSSIPTPDATQHDPYNLQLSHQSRFRLDAEFIRDNALSVSGLLVSTVGGRSVRPYQPPGLYRHLNFPTRKYKADKDENQYRRGVYTHWQRQFLHPAMKSFDAPAREECTAERPRSNTPLAALVLLNDPSYVEAARVFAERAFEAKSTTPNRIQWMIQNSLFREPNAREKEILTELYYSHHQYYLEHRDEAKQIVGVGISQKNDHVPVAELAAWTSVTRTIFNMHEFVNRN